MPSRLRRAAAELTAPTLLHVQWDDEVFFRDGQLELFDLIESPAKRLIAFPGLHSETPPGAVESWREFIAGHLQVTVDSSAR
jgi:hypothetical protein